MRPEKWGGCHRSNVNEFLAAIFIFCDAQAFGLFSNGNGFNGYRYTMRMHRTLYAITFKTPFGCAICDRIQWAIIDFPLCSGTEAFMPTHPSSLARHANENRHGVFIF